MVNVTGAYSTRVKTIYGYKYTRLSFPNNPVFWKGIDFYSIAWRQIVDKSVLLRAVLKSILLHPCSRSLGFVKTP